VVAYRWWSSIDGDLSTRASFEASSLSEGKHAIYLKVQDNNGAWSREVQDVVAIVSSEAAGLPVINSFDANPETITSGEPSTLSWSVSDATTASIDQGIGSVALTSTRLVSPATTTIYTLTATSGAGSVTATAQVIVSAAVGLPLINSFTANPWSITAGDSSMLSWNVSDAAAVTINPGVGAVASPGNTSVSPAITTTYTLTATNAAGTVSVAVTVVVSVAPVEHTVNILPVVNESGYVRNTGAVTPKYMYAGDDTGNLSLQGFISFDISGIPAGATITAVVVDFSNYNTIYGNPFGNLGCLRIYPDDYGILDGGDYFAGPPSGAILGYCSAGAIVAHSDTNVKNALQTKVGSSRFQVRLQFTAATNGDGNNDIMRWDSSHLPKLTVTYTAP